MMIERRLRRLEAAQAGDGGVIVIRKLANEPDGEAMHRHFGEQESPKNALIVLLRTFSSEAAL